MHYQRFLIKKNFSKPLQQNFSSFAYNNSRHSFKRSSLKDASSGDLIEARAATPELDSFMSFDENLLSLIKHDLAANHASQFIKLTSLPRLSSIMKGFRLGEFTIVSGPTGCGKTTFLAQLSLDYAFQGVPTMWGSFEVKHTRLARLMIEQTCEQSLYSADNEIDDNILRAGYERLFYCPISFMNFFGSTSLNSIMHAMNMAVEKHNIQHFVLDNLQFMLSGQGTNSLDKFDLADRAIGVLREFSTKRSVHVTLVIHPRKELDDSPLGLASISGTAKATQEADNVIILQKINNTRTIDVKKNRFDGALGSIEVEFNPIKKSLVEK